MVNEELAHDGLAQPTAPRESDRLYALDMMFFIHRAFHAVPDLRSPCGSPINALYGVVSLLRELWRLERYRQVVAVFESPTPSFRHQLDPQYKANRSPAAPELRAQVAMVRVACECLGISTVHVEGYEADDVLGTLARQAVEAARPVTIVSNDKDLAQVLALGPAVELLRTTQNGRPERVDARTVSSMYGVPPELITSWLAIRGDASDNIKGVKGIGQKTAVKLLLEQGDLLALLAEPDKTGRFSNIFRTERERILLDLKLATIRTDVELEFPDDAYGLRPIDGAAEFFRSLGMMGHVRQLQEVSAPGATVAELWDEPQSRLYYG